MIVLFSGITAVVWVREGIFYPSFLLISVIAMLGAWIHSFIQYLRERR